MKCPHSSYLHARSLVGGAVRGAGESRPQGVARSLGG